MSKAEWSGWIQAIDSILAILGSVFIVNLQHQREIARRDDERMVEIKAAFDSVKVFIGTCTATLNQLIEGGKQHSMDFKVRRGFSTKVSHFLSTLKSKKRNGFRVSARRFRTSNRTFRTPSELLYVGGYGARREPVVSAW